MLSTDARLFAGFVAKLGRETGALVDPVFIESQFRLNDLGVQIDLFNPWHGTGCHATADEAVIARMLQPVELGEAGYLGRIDVVRRFLAAGADPNALEPDGVSPLRRTLAAWVTTDLHVDVVTTLFDAGLVVDRTRIGGLLAETAGTAIDVVLAELLESRAR